LYIPRKDVQVPYYNTNEEFEFLPIDWYECDIEEDNHEKGFFLNKTHNKNILYFRFGVTSKGESVCLKITNYHPYLYFQIPDDFTQQNIRDLKANFLMDDVDEDIEYDDYKIC
jgi:hypothetical protein